MFKVNPKICPRHIFVSSTVVHQAKRSFVVGQNLLDVKHDMRNASNKTVTNDELFKNKKVVVLGVPGAFTPVCSTQHVPTFVKDAEKLKQKGISSIYCVSVNDSFTMNGWKESLKSGNNIEYLADWNGAFTKGIGQSIDLSGAALGPRSKRFVMLVDNGKVVFENVEQSPGECKITTSQEVLKQL
mmetsp:Transcript_20048/g.28055  ORF Transcript_20048/g.28055 Transcript_20048/m.28055 type:complete len:185 (+) Transcript_20048:1648-2202(+)